MTRSRLVLVLLAALSACTTMPAGGAPPDIQLRASPATLAPGDSLTLVLSNDTAEGIGYNLCSSTLERSSGGAWEAVASDRVCTMELRTLAPGAADEFTFALAARLEPGRYRALTNIERLTTGDRLAVVTEPFEVSR